MDHLATLIEAALFSAAHPLSINDLGGLEPAANKSDVEAALGQLRDHYVADGHAFELVELADGYQLLTRRDFAEAITEARIAARPRRLSAAALETLAIIAYRQPVGRSEVEDIRGVAADGVLRSLSERNLIEIVGRGDGLGRPLLYGTTPIFLEMLGLNDLKELPRLDQLAVALRPLSEPPGEQPGVRGAVDEDGEELIPEADEELVEEAEEEPIDEAEDPDMLVKEVSVSEETGGPEVL